MENRFILFIFLCCTLQRPATKSTNRTILFPHYNSLQIYRNNIFLYTNTSATRNSYNNSIRNRLYTKCEFIRKFDLFHPKRLWSSALCQSSSLNWRVNIARVCSFRFDSLHSTYIIYFSVLCILLFHYIHTFYRLHTTKEKVFFCWTSKSSAFLFFLIRKFNFHSRKSG